tara:strand:- start:14 stop:727 length:714 start_codon:yes stop_codon:yes gene_type:complete
MKKSSSKVFTLSPKTADAIASTYATWDEAKRKSNHDQKLFVIEIAKAYQSWDGSKEAFNDEVVKLLNVAKSQIANWKKLGAMLLQLTPKQQHQKDFPVSALLCIAQRGQLVLENAKDGQLLIDSPEGKKVIRAGLEWFLKDCNGSLTTARDKNSGKAKRQAKTATPSTAKAEKAASEKDWTTAANGAIKILESVLANCNEPKTIESLEGKLETLMIQYSEKVEENAKMPKAKAPAKA